MEKTLVLEGIAGSQAYGLATPESDVDHLGVFVAPTREFLGVSGLTKTQETDHCVGAEKDFTHHELGKFCRLALGGNPTVIELLFMEDYTIRTEIGDALLDLRGAFLSERVRNSYVGYAVQQKEKLIKGGDYGHGFRKRYEKHTRHCFRLLFQGRELLETGHITLKVSPEMRDKLFRLGTLPPEDLVPYFEHEKDRIDSIRSVLPKEPNVDVVNEFLVETRVSLL